MDPVTELMRMVCMMHEAYESFRAAGFSEDQSMRLVMHMMTNAGNQPESG